MKKTQILNTTNVYSIQWLIKMGKSKFYMLIYVLHITFIIMI